MLFRFYILIEDSTLLYKHVVFEEENIQSKAAKRCFPSDRCLGWIPSRSPHTWSSQPPTRSLRLPFLSCTLLAPSVTDHELYCDIKKERTTIIMDFDDLLIAKLHTPSRNHTPTPPPQPTTETSTPPDPSSAPSLPRPTATPKDGESYYIKPIPSGLRGATLADLMTLCHTHTLTHGYDVVKKAGVKPTCQRGGRKTIIPGGVYYKWHITCVLGGKPKNTRHLTEDQRRRDKASLKMGCPSRVWAWAVDREHPEGEWEIRWGDTDPALHNHPPVDVRTLPNHRRRAREAEGVQEAIRKIAEQGMGRREGLLRLRELFPEGLFSEKDVANELQKYKGLLKQQRAAHDHQDGEQEEMEGVEEEEADRQSQGQLQSQTTREQQHLQQQRVQHQQPPPQQQHHNMFVQGVSAYW